MVELCKAHGNIVIPGVQVRGGPACPTCLRDAWAEISALLNAVKFPKP